MIDFTDNKHGHFALSGIYLWRSVKNLGLGVLDGLRWLHENVIKRYTLACMAVVVFVSVLLSTVQIGKARIGVAQRHTQTREIENARTNLKENRYV